MKICLIADGQSPHSQSWIKLLADHGHEIFLISTYPVYNEIPVVGWEFIPIDVSAKARSHEKAVALGTAQSERKGLISRLRGGWLWRTLAQTRDALMPLTVRAATKKVRQIIERERPDIVHGMRITFEGILAAEASRGLDIPLVLSSWGADFTMFDKDSKFKGAMTKRAMARADGFHSDCVKDIGEAKAWGMPDQTPTIVAPGNGGIRRDVFYAGRPSEETLRKYDIRPGSKVVINPRGFRHFTRNDTFFAALPIVLASVPSLVVLLLGMKGKAGAQKLVEQYHLEAVCRWVDHVPHDDMAELFRAADISVSPMRLDGTPNSMLEAMACGALPVANPLLSVQEWITHDVNGLMFDVDSPEDCAAQMIRGLTDDELRARARLINEEIVATRAETEASCTLLLDLYQRAIINHTQVLP